jgi:hypothetical protein
MYLLEEQLLGVVWDVENFSQRGGILPFDGIFSPTTAFVCGANDLTGRTALPMFPAANRRQDIP